METFCPDGARRWKLVWRPVVSSLFLKYSGVDSIAWIHLITFGCALWILFEKCKKNSVSNGNGIKNFSCSRKRWLASHPQLIHLGLFC